LENLTFEFPDHKSVYNLTIDVTEEETSPTAFQVGIIPARTVWNITLPYVVDLPTNCSGPLNLGTDLYSNLFTNETLNFLILFVKVSPVPNLYVVSTSGYFWVF